MKITDLSTVYQVRQLHEADIHIIYPLCTGNPDFYRFHPPFVTVESIRQDMHSLPPGKTQEDLYYLGYFKENTLVAVMALVAGYPDEATAYIGFFMMTKEYQNKGIGSSIIHECKEGLTRSGYRKIRLGVDQGNEHSFHFWTRNGFVPIAQGEYITMEWQT